MKLDQLCFYCNEPWQAEAVKRMFGLTDEPWVQDTVEMLTRIPPREDWHESIAELNFCESLGMQLEIMRFTQGPHWSMGNNRGSIYIAHIGMHLNEGEAWPEIGMGTLVQESKTISHSAAAFHDKTSPQYGRRYHYRIHRMPYSGGNVFIKLIKRVHRNG